MAITTFNASEQIHAAFVSSRNKVVSFVYHNMLLDDHGDDICLIKFYVTEKLLKYFLAINPRRLHG